MRVPQGLGPPLSESLSQVILQPLPPHAATPVSRFLLAFAIEALTVERKRFWLADNSELALAAWVFGLWAPQKFR